MVKKIKNHVENHHPFKFLPSSLQKAKTVEADCLSKCRFAACHEPKYC